MSLRVSISIQVIESPAEGIRQDYIRRHISTSGSQLVEAKRAQLESMENIWSLVLHIMSLRVSMSI